MSNKTEFTIGESVTMGLVDLVCEEADDKCKGCHFEFAPWGYNCGSYTGYCDNRHRSDKLNVIFVTKEE